MSFSTNHRVLAVLAGSFLGLMIGCQSTKPSFSFQPVALRAAAPSGPVAHALSTPAAPTTAMPRASSSEASVPGPAPRRNRPVAQRRAERVLEAEATRPVVRTSALHRRPLFGRAHAAAERGLGTTVLGVLGLVALPVALLGLALSGGGLGWALIAGVAAVAVLVAYLDPFGH